MLRPVMRVDHAREIIEMDSETHFTPNEGKFELDIGRWAGVPRAGRLQQGYDVLDRIETIKAYNWETHLKPKFDALKGGKLLILAGGTGYAFTLEALADLGIEADVVKVEMPYPLPREEIVARFEPYEHVLVVEEPYPLIEEDLAHPKLYGKKTGTMHQIDEMKKKRGLKLRIDNVVFNEQATKDAIKRFVDGIGEPNPLWRDMEYAKKTRYGTIVAPPSWVFSALAGVQFGWSGLAGFHIATEMKFHIPVRLNDRLTFDATYLDFTGPKESHFAGKIVIDRFQEKYFNQRGDLIAVSIRKILRAERKKARMMALYGDIELPHPWTEGEIRAIEPATITICLKKILPL